ncbi:MAG: carbamoyltransferase [Candidatus Gastranaerophilales bacterium]|nr:carbamoyltransferase [Candidatus Gastranaerophilales bacterium]
MTYILGISSFFHDSGAAIVKNGEILAASHEERFTRHKHDSAFPKNAIDFCMSYAEIDPEQLDGVVYYEKPLVKFERILETQLAMPTKSLPSFVKAMPVWLNTKLHMPSIIDKHFENRLKCPIYFSTHHGAHAASAFYPSPFENAAFICLDGVGEWTTSSWGTGNGNKINFEQVMEFPHSLGLLYSAFTGYLGFRVNSGEYKVMGLAPYGEDKYSQIIRDNLIDIKEDGSFWLNQEYFDYCTGTRMYNKKFEKLFGLKTRKAEGKITPQHTDIAKSLQVVTEEIILKIARNVRKVSGEKNLCLAGGCALNCVANGKILKEEIFDNIWIQPASGDAGGALGAALWGYYEVLKNERKIVLPDAQKGSLLGIDYAPEKIKESLDKIGAKYRQIDDEFGELTPLIAKYISEGKSIGHMNGRAEFGPRALGNRSILADARNTKMQRKLNLAVKKRESFRPFAPTCLEEDASEFFDIKEGLTSPYMLLTVDVSENVRTPLKQNDENLFGIEKLNVVRSLIPAVTHVDYSARLQTVNRETNPRYYSIIEEFKKLTDCSVVVNTSFNVRGEPLVNSPEDAYRCFMFTDLDVLVIGNFVMLKNEQPPLKGYKKYLKTLISD